MACLAVLALGGLGARAQAPLPGEIIDPPRGDQRFVVLGDFNGPYGALDYPPPVARVLAAVTQVWRPDLLLSPGDVIAGQSQALSAEELRAMWQAFDRQIAAELRLASVPYAFALGNHDGSSLTTAGGGYRFPLDRVAAADYWGQAMYRDNLAYVDRRNHPFHYAFTAQEAFVAIIDASSANVGPAQRSWLAEVLATPAARAARLRIVVGHLPLFAVGQGRDQPGEVIADAEQLLELFERAAVDLYVSGHHAAYYPGRSGAVELLFAGGIGARRLLGDDRPPRSTVTIVDVWYEPMRLVYTTFDAATLEVLEPDGLPAALISGVRLSQRARPPLAGTVP